MVSHTLYLIMYPCLLLFPAIVTQNVKHELNFTTKLIYHVVPKECLTVTLKNKQVKGLHNIGGIACVCIIIPLLHMSQPVTNSYILCSSSIY